MVCNYSWMEIPAQQIPAVFTLASTKGKKAYQINPSVIRTYPFIKPWKHRLPCNSFSSHTAQMNGPTATTICICSFCSVPEEGKLALPLRFRLRALSAPSVSPKAFHNKVFSQSKHWLLPYLPGSVSTHHQSGCFQVSGRPSAQEIDRFLQPRVRGEEVLCASHSWLCCRLEWMAVDSRVSETTQTQASE